MPNDHLIAPPATVRPIPEHPASPALAQIAVGIDVGGTKIAAGLIGRDASLGTQHLVPTPQRPDDLLDAIVSAALAVMPDDRLLPVGCGFPGLVDRDGRIVAGPNVALKDFPLGTALRERLGVPVLVDNDANAAAWAEYRFGAAAARPPGARVVENMAMVTLGTGVGGGLILNGRLFRGSHGFAAELGHVILRAGGRMGPSGIHGELEAFCSGTALRSLGVEAVARGDAADSVLRDVRHIDGDRIAEAADHGDPLATELLTNLGTDLGTALASVVNMLDVDLIVIGGGLSAVHRHFLAHTREALHRNLLGAARRPEVPVVLARLGNDAGTIGAGLLAAEL